jgi:hypothetical protein
MKKTILLLTAAFGLTMSAHARLGWTMEDCRAHWGDPINVFHNSQFNLDGYNFRVSPELVAQVWFLNDRVQSLDYCTKNTRFLITNVQQLLQKNFPGAWRLYDDGRGKETLKSWQAFDETGSRILAYALLWNKPERNGFFHLQVSTNAWGIFTATPGGTRTLESSDGSNGLNI